MPFNADTYHANRLRREATEYLAEAREIKRRAALGDAYDWEVDLIPGLCKRAILNGRMARSRENIRDMSVPAHR